LECQPIVATQSEHITPGNTMNQEQCNHQTSSTQQIKIWHFFERRKKKWCFPNNSPNKQQSSSQGSTVGMVTNLWPGKPRHYGLISSRAKRLISYDWLWDPTWPPIKWISGHTHKGYISTGMWSWPLTPSNVQFKNMWSYISNLPICLHRMYRSNFTFKQHST
jgi:hypothetical protein